MTAAKKLETTDLNEMVPFLKNTVLFGSAGDDALRLIASRLERVHYKKGDPIVLENETSDHVYLLYSGSAEVVKNLPELNRMTRLALLKPGDPFSEFSVLNRSTKSASVFALEDSELLRMTGDSFLEVLRQLPQVAKSLAIHIARLTEHVQSSRLNVEYTQPERIALHPQIPRILPQSFWRRFETLPIRFEHQCLFVAMKNPQNPAFFEFMANRMPNLQIYVSLIGNLDFDLLEKELLANYNSPVAAPAVTVPPPMTGDPIEWLAQLAIFREIPRDWLPDLAQSLNRVQFSAGQTVYRRDEPSESLYIVQSGVVTFSFPIASHDANRAAGWVYVGSASAGDYISEVSLLNQSAHLLTAKAATDTVLYTLPKDIFLRLLETPYLSLPLACDLALQFQTIRSHSFPYFDESQGLHLLELADLLPRSMMEQYEILPLRLHNDELTIGMTNIESEAVYSVMARYLQNYRVKLEIIKNSDFKKWLNELKSVKADGPTGLHTVATGLPSAPVNSNKKTDVVSALNAVLESGLNSRASDVHIEPAGDSYTVRYRIDGVLLEGAEKFPKHVGAEMLNRIKILSQLDLTNRFTPQDGQLKTEIGGNTLFARVSTMPTKRGEKAAIRLIRPKNSVPPLSALTPDRRILQILGEIVNTRQGVFLVTGPTGSGKSTTLYSLLREVNRVNVNIVTLEDPVEMEVAGINQVEINEAVGLTFPVALRSALRQDPNIILIGEIRDEDSAKIAFHAASTGHLVLSTLHTNDSLNVIPRLRELGIANGILSSTLIGASAQRLLRKICDHCREPRPITAAEADIIKSELQVETAPRELIVGKGCMHCGHTGYRDRIAVVEAWTKTRAIENILSGHNDMDRMVSTLRSEGFETLRQFAVKMARNGLTTLDEVSRVVGGTYLERERQ